MLGSIRDLTTVILAGIIMLVVLLVFFMVTLKGSELSYDTFNSGLANFNTCIEGNEYTVADYSNEQVLTMNVERLAAMREDLDVEEACNTDFVVSSDEQITTYAEDVYNEISNKYPGQDFGLLDTVYTAPAKYYAYLGIPQDYLFFAMSSDESQMIGYIYSPTADGYELNELWSIDESSDLDTVQNYTNNLLVKYYEKVI